MPMYDYLYLLESDTAITADAYSTHEVNFGIADKKVGNDFGMHVIVTTTFGACVSIDFRVFTGVATAPTTNIAASRNVLLADLVKGAHFFIPCPPTLDQYVRAHYVTNTDADAGKVTVYLGEAGQGAE